jgi:hypothetical protein
LVAVIGVMGVLFDSRASSKSQKPRMYIRGSELKARII